MRPKGYRTLIGLRFKQFAKTLRMFKTQLECISETDKSEVDNFSLAFSISFS